MTKRIFSFLLALAMLIGMLPMMATEAEAASYTLANNSITGEQIVAEARKWANRGAVYWSNPDESWYSGSKWLKSIYWRTGYSYDGQTSFDCSGFAGRVLNDCGFRSTNYTPSYGDCILKEKYGSGYIGISIEEQMKYGTDITSSVKKAKSGDYSELQPGDLLAWTSCSVSGLSQRHVVIYAGMNNGKPWMVEFTGSGFLDRAITSAYQQAFQYGSRLAVQMPENKWIKESYACHGKIVIGSSSAYVKSLPCSEATDSASKSIEPATKDSTYTAIGLVRNSATSTGNLWYKVTAKTGETGYIYAGDVSSFTQSYTDVSLTGVNKPVEIVKGKPFSVTGVCNAPYQKITKVYAWVLSADGSTKITGKELTVDTSKYDFSSPDIDYNVKFDTLSVGTYRYRLGGTIQTYYAKSATETGTKEITGYWYDVEFRVVESTAPSTYTVSYNANGGSGAPASQTKTHGVTLTLSSTVPTRSGYTFLGWSTSSTATSATYQPGGAFTVNANTTLYAVWKQNTNTVKLYASTQSVNLSLDGKTSETIYVWQNFYNDSMYLNCEWGQNVNFEWHEIQSDGKVPVTISAVSAGTCNVIFTTRDAETHAELARVTVSVTVSPEKEIHTTTNSITLTLGGTESQVINVWATGSYPNGCYFNWQRSNDNVHAQWGQWADDGSIPLTIVANKKGTTTITLSVKDSETDETYDTFVINVTVNAKEYTISYNANGGTGAPSSQTKTHGTDLTLSTTVPTRFGYTFLGWSTDAAATAEMYRPGDNYVANKNTTLYAVWQAASAFSSDLTSNSFGPTIHFVNGYVFYSFTPSFNGKVRFESTGNGDTRIYLYDSNGTELASNDDSGEGNNFLLDYAVTSGRTYYVKVKFFGSGTGTIQGTAKRVYDITYNANGGSGAPSAQTKVYGTALTLSSTVPTRSGYTFQGWATSSTATSATYQPGGSYATNANVTLYAVWKVNGPVITTQPVNTYVKSGVNASLSVKATGTGLTYQWQYRTSSTGTWNATTLSGAKTATLTVPGAVSRNGYQYRCVITDANGNTVTSNAATLTVFGIKTQPASASAKAGATVTFKVAAIGNGLTYQWQWRANSSSTWAATTVSGNKTATITVPATTARNGYQYRCKITDSKGDVLYSNAATLTVKSGPVINTQPASVTANVGATATFKVVATGTGLTYQWQWRANSSSTWASTTVSGNRTAAISVPATAARNGYQYRCKITDANNNVVYSNAVTLTVKAALAITTQPKSVTANVGETATFKVVATGTGLTYQWQWRANSSSAWASTTVSGNKTETISVPVTAARNGYQYRCKITDANGKIVYSNAATLTVKSGPVINTQPKSVTANVGETVTFKVAAIGNGLTYQWQWRKNASSTWASTTVSGNKTATITVPATAARNGYQYRCKITDTNGNVIYSNAATLTVK